MPSGPRLFVGYLGWVLRPRNITDPCTKKCIRLHSASLPLARLHATYQSKKKVKWRKTLHKRERIWTRTTDYSHPVWYKPAFDTAVRGVLAAPPKKLKQPTQTKIHTIASSHCPPTKRTPLCTDYATASTHITYGTHSAIVRSTINESNQPTSNNPSRTLGSTLSNQLQPLFDTTPYSALVDWTPPLNKSPHHNYDKNADYTRCAE